MTRNAALLLITRLSSAVTTVAVLSFVARLRGPEELGFVGIGFAAGAILAVVTDLGLSRLLVREASRDIGASDQLFGAILIVRVLVVPVVLAVAWLVLDAAFEQGAFAIWLGAAGIVLQMWADLPRSVLLAHGRVAALSVHGIIENFGWLLAVGGLLVLGASLELALGAGLATFAISLLAGIALVRVAAGVKFARPARVLSRRLTGDALPFALYTLLGTAVTRIDTLLVGVLVPQSAIAAAGAYYAAMRLLAAFEYLPDALSRSLLPPLARTYVSDPSALGPALRQPTRFLVLAGTPIPFGLIVIGPWLLELLFGEGIGAYGWVLIGLGILIPFRFVLGPLGVTLTSIGGMWRRVAGTAAAFTVVVSVDLALLPRFGIAGAVIGAAAGTLVLFAIYATSVLRLVGSLGLLSSAWKAVLAAVIALAGGIATRVLADSHLPAVSEPAAGVVLALTYLFVAAGAFKLHRAPPDSDQPCCGPSR